jgi:hypothetical protein
LKVAREYNVQVATLYNVYQGACFYNNFEGAENALSNRRNPFFTLVAVWIVLSSGLTLVILSPAFSMILFFVLAVAGCVIYRTRHKDLANQDLAKSLALNLGHLVAKIVEDSRIGFTQAAAWYQQREARIEQEMIQERERQAQRRERLQELQRKRRERPTSEYLTPGEYEVYKELRKRNESTAEQQSQREFL